MFKPWVIGAVIALIGSGCRGTPSWHEVSSTSRDAGAQSGPACATAGTAATGRLDGRQDQESGDTATEVVQASAVQTIPPSPSAGAAPPQTASPADRPETTELGSVPDTEIVALTPPAQVSSGLTLAQLKSIAASNNPTLAAARARMSAASGRRTQAGLYPNPVIGYHGTEIGNLGTAGAQGGFVRQTFVTGGKLKLDQAVAARGVDRAHALVHAQQQRVRSDVALRFYETLVAQRRVTLADELAGIAGEVTDATQTLLDGGRAAANDLLQAQIRADEAAIRLDNARNQASESWRRLAVVVGVPDLEETPLSGGLEDDLPHLDWESCRAHVLTSNPQLQAARARAAGARTAIERARREPIPDVDVFVSARHQNVTGDDVANVIVGIPLPVFDRNQGAICAAQAEHVAACRELDRIELMLQQRLATEYRRFANAEQQIQRYAGSILPAASDSLDLVKTAYAQGRTDYLGVLLAQQTYVQASLTHLGAIWELRAAAAVIDGQLLSESLGQTGRGD